jgi:hypothetical protein
MFLMGIMDQLRLFLSVNPAVAGRNPKNLSAVRWLPLLLLLITSAGAHAQEFTYTIANNEVTITGYTGTDTVISIPATIDGLPVTSIGGFAFHNSSITSVTIPNSVTSIEGSAFWNCRNLTSIAIPDSVRSIGVYAFLYCYALDSVTMGNSVTNIAIGAFSST